MTELSDLDLISCTVSRLTECNVDIGTKNVPEVHYAEASFIASIDDHDWETRPGMYYEEWWAHIAKGMEFSLGGLENLKEDICQLAEPWLQAVGCRPTP